MFLKENIKDYDIYKEDIIHWVNLKGEYRYNAIINFMKQLNIECTWRNVTAYIKYDKRILINCFKYIIFLEELYKSYIIKYKKDKTSNVFKYSFSKSLDEYLLIEGSTKYDDIHLELLINNKNSLIELRNSIVHNKMLLTHKYDGKTLCEVLNIFIYILPKSYRSGYIKDINNCKKGLIDSTWSVELQDRG